MVNCDIKFSSAQGIYYSGQTLSIQVSLRFEKAKKFRSIYVVFNGRAKCSLSKNYGTHARRQRVVYRAEEIYVNTKSYLHGNETTETTELSAGTHVYTVACALPPELPSSFEGNYGSIRYSVKVVVDRPWKFDHTFEEIFTVLKQYDLNFDSSLRLPFERQKVSTFCFWPFRTGPLQVIVKLPQTGFVPGQIVPVTVDINNDSGTSINYFRLLLMKYVLYHAQTPRPKTRRQREIVVNNRVEKNILGMGRTQAQLSLEIPSLPPTNIIHNRIIHITYELKVCAKTPRCSEDLEIRVPIVIGTVPIFTGPPPMASSSSDGADGPGFNPNLPPPSYEECVSGKDDMKEEDSDNKSNTKPFAPMYPVYRYDVASHSATTPPTLQSPPPQKFYPNP